MRCYNCDARSVAIFFCSSKVPRDSFTTVIHIVKGGRAPVKKSVLKHEASDDAMELKCGRVKLEYTANFPDMKVPMWFALQNKLKALTKAAVPKYSIGTRRTTRIGQTDSQGKRKLSDCRKKQKNF